MTDAVAVRDHLQMLKDALDAHLLAVEGRSGESDPAVFAAFVHLADAFSAYEEALYDTHDEVVPMTILEYEDDEPDDDAGDGPEIEV
jgi:hypothetical protein